MVVPLLVEIAADMDVSVAVAGQLGTATFAAWAPSVALSGPLSDSFGRRPIVLAGLFLASVGALACAFAPSFELLLVFRVVAGIGAGTIPVCVSAAVADVFSAERRAQAISGLMSVNVLSAAVSVPTLALLADWGGWRHSFVAAGLLLSAAFALNYVWFPRDSRERVRDFAIVSRYRALLSMTFFKAAVFVMAAHRIAFWGLVSYFAAFLIQTYGLGVGATAAPLAIIALGQVVGAYSAGYAARIGNRILLIAAACGAGGLCGLMFFSVSMEYWMAVAVAAVGSGLLNIPSPVLIALSTEYSGRSRATGIGLIGLGNQFGGVGGAAIAGALLANVGFGGIGYLCAGAPVLACLSVPLLRRRPEASADN